MTSRCSPRLLVISALLGLAAQVAAAPVIVDYSTLLTQAYDGGYDIDSVSSTAYGTQTVSSSIGGNSSTSYSNWLDTGSGALFAFDVEHARSGQAENYALSYSQLHFTVGENNTSYSLSGLYAMTGPANMTYSYVSLLTGLGAVLFEDYNYSMFTANEMLTLGAVGDADTVNATQGSLTGTLLAGEQYFLRFTNYIQAYPQTDSGATATGCLTLSIGGASGDGICGARAVPEPGSLALAGLALAGLALARRKVCHRGLLPVHDCESDRQLCGGEISAANVSSGSQAARA